MLNLVLDPTWPVMLGSSGQLFGGELSNKRREVQNKQRGKSSEPFVWMICELSKKLHVLAHPLVVSLL